MANPATHAHGSSPGTAHAYAGAHKPRVTITRTPTRAMRVRWDCSGLTAERSTRANAPPKSARPTTYVVARSPDGGRLSRNGKTRAHP